MQTSANFGAYSRSSVDAMMTSVDIIRHAHERSAAYGLRESDVVDVMPLASPDLQEALQRNQTLTSHALPVMETLYQQIEGTRSMVLLTDHEGTILHALGDDDFVSRAQRVALQPGGIWSEARKGTNAIGTALSAGHAVQVHAGQHYLRANQFLTCACAPIIDPHGQAVGALDVSGDHRALSRHTMALVRMSAQMVENHLWNKTFEDAVRLRFHARAEFLGTLMEGLAAFTPEGRFLSANRSGQFQLGMSLSALQAHTFSSLFGQDISAVLTHSRQTNAGALTLRLPGGVSVMAHVEFRNARLHSGWAPLTHPDIAADKPMPSPTAHRATGSALPWRGLKALNTGDARMAQALDTVTRFQGRDIATLILGETGTGKELLARAIHHDGPRREGPFVAVNCASIPESLIESELFGYEEGAFTGARRKGQPGKIALAHRGTLFLDEIGDMPLSLQARLLRVLQERTVAPLGGGRQIDVDLHVVCATHRPLRDMMAAGTFRQDLYYRLNGLVVRLPALRERTDLDTLVERIVQEHAHGPLRVSTAVMEVLRQCVWPGNLRQLSNVLRTAALMAEGQSSIEMHHLPEDFMEDLMPVDVEGNCSTEPARLDVPLGGRSVPDRTHVELLETTTFSAVERAMALHSGNVSAVARALGVSRNTVYRYLRKSAR